jgi:hypothetical protein
LNRLGFWHGACGPAACWAGGAVGLVDYASIQHRDDPHTMAHLGAMMASTWALHRYLEAAGDEIDEVADTPAKAHKLALTVRHLVEQACTDILRRLPRAYGPHPLAMNEEISRRYQEVDLYVGNRMPSGIWNLWATCRRWRASGKERPVNTLWYPQSRSNDNTGLRQTSSRLVAHSYAAHGSITILVTFSFLSRHTLYISGACSRLMR